MNVDGQEIIKVTAFFLSVPGDVSYDINTIIAIYSGALPHYKLVFSKSVVKSGKNQGTVNWLTTGLPDIC